MKIRERLELRREARGLFRRHRSEGMEVDAAAEATLAAMEEKYGESLDWAAILEFLILILSLFMRGES